MKKLIGLVSILGVLFACQPKNATLSGSIENANMERLLLYDVTGRVVLDSLKVEEGGSFLKEITQEGYYSLLVKRQQVLLYLEPGFETKVQFDATKVKESLTFSGKGAAENQFLSEMQTFQMENIGKKRQSLYTAELASFEEQIGVVKEEYLSFVDNYFQENKASKAFEGKERKRIDYLVALLKQNYGEYASVFQNKEVEISTSFFDFEAPLLIEDENLFDLPEYIMFYKSCIRKESEKEAETSDLSADKIYFDKLAKLNNQKLRTQLANSYMSNFALTDNVEEVYENFMKVSDDEKVKEKITEMYEVLRKVAKGKPAPDFEYKDINDKVHRLSDFKGNVILIDLWATWCGPCLRQIPAMKKLEEEYHGKPVVFMGISVDKNEDIPKWKDFVVKRELGGVQLHADQGFMSSFPRAFLVNAIPRFIIIDKEGNVANSSAPFPSDEEEELKAILDGLI